MTQSLTHTLQDILKTQFKFNEFRPGQLETITDLLTFNRLVCIQPTGYGKSLLYQIPAVYLGGVTLVISPLLALIRDQILQLKNRFNINAGTINTDQTGEENEKVKKALLTGKMQLLFIAPEQLENQEQFNFLQKLPIQLLVIDEAHCISSWGHDFRPSYRQIMQLVKVLTSQNPNLKVLALTATANLQTEQDITEQIKTNEHNKVIIHRESMNRANIKLSVLRVSGVASKLATLKQLLQRLKGCGIIYCSTRENTEMVARYLVMQKFQAAAYHAGLPLSDKLSLQQQFVDSDGLVIAATNALGMGIDKANLRYVIHFDFPGSMTAYYQEVGRAGRDQLPAEGILLYDRADRKIHQYFISNVAVSEEEATKVIQVMQSEFPTLANIRRLSGVNPTKLNIILSDLLDQKIISKIFQNNISYFKLIKPIKSDLARVQTRSKQILQTKLAELAKMQAYAEQDEKCLMSILREALGDSNQEHCGKCSGCTPTCDKVIEDKTDLLPIFSWLTKRTLPFEISHPAGHVASGMAVLDGRRSSVDYQYFMNNRAEVELNKCFTNPLMQLIKDCLIDLAQTYLFTSVVSIPSASWEARQHFCAMVSEYLRVPFEDLQQLILQKKNKIPKGPILLIDDYVRSGATMQKAITTLYDYGVTNPIIPFAIAAF